MPYVRTVLASDIDNTLTGDSEALQSLVATIDRLREQNELLLVLTTGRTLEEVLNGFEQENIPYADAIISQVGTEIYLPPFADAQEPLAAWNDVLRKRFSRERAEAFVSDIEGAEPQGEHYNTPLKVSYLLENAPDPEKAVSRIRQRIAEAGANEYQVVWSSGKHLDILPAAAGKGRAIRFLLDFLGIQTQQIVTAGDSGNDYSMLDEFKRGIIVANAQPELKSLRVTSQADFYFAEKPFAAGVKEGLHHFGILPAPEGT